MTAASTTPAGKLQDRLAGGLHHAVAIRLLLRYLEAREDAVRHGADPAALPMTQEVTPALSNLLCDHYRKLIDEWLAETPRTARAVRASMALSAEIVAETLMEDFSGGGPVGMFADACHLLKLLQNVDGFLIEVEGREAFAEERERDAL